MNHFPVRSYPWGSWPIGAWPDLIAQAIAPDGLLVGVAFGLPVVAQPGVVQAIEPDGYALALALGDIVVTRRAAVDVPLYVIDLDTRVYEVPAESRVYIAEA